MTSKLGAEALGQLFSVDEASVKEAAVAYFSLADRSVDVSSLSVAQGGFLCAHCFFSVKTHLILAQCVFVLLGHRLYRDIVGLLIASVAILKIGIFSDTAI